MQKALHAAEESLGVHEKQHSREMSRRRMRIEGTLSLHMRRMEDRVKRVSDEWRWHFSARSAETVRGVKAERDDATLKLRESERDRSALAVQLESASDRAKIETEAYRSAACGVSTLKTESRHLRDELEQCRRALADVSFERDRLRVDLEALAADNHRVSSGLPPPACPAPLPQSDTRVCVLHQEATQAAKVEALWEDESDRWEEQLRDALDDAKAAKGAFPAGPKAHSAESIHSLCASTARVVRMREREHINAFFDSRPSWIMEELASVLHDRGYLEAMWDTKPFQELRGEEKRTDFARLERDYWHSRFGLHLHLHERMAWRLLSRINDVGSKQLNPKTGRPERVVFWQGDNRQDNVVYVPRIIPPVHQCISLFDDMVEELALSVDPSGQIMFQDLDTVVQQVITEDRQCQPELELFTGQDAYDYWLICSGDGATRRKWSIVHWIMRNLYTPQATQSCKLIALARDMKDNRKGARATMGEVNIGKLSALDHGVTQVNAAKLTPQQLAREAAVVARDQALHGEAEPDTETAALRLAVFAARDAKAPSADVPPFEVHTRLCMCCDLKAQREMTNWIGSGGCCCTENDAWHYVPTERRSTLTTWVEVERWLDGFCHLATLREMYRWAHRALPGEELPEPCDLCAFGHGSVEERRAEYAACLKSCASLREQAEKGKSKAERGAYHKACLKHAHSHKNIRLGEEGVPDIKIPMVQWLLDMLHMIFLNLPKVACKKTIFELCPGSLARDPW